MEQVMTACSMYHYTSNMKQPTIGLLFPRSSSYPGIGYDVTEGFKAALNYYGQNIKVVTESVGIGGIGDEVYKAAENLLMNHGVDIVVAFVDHFAAEKIEPLCNAANKLLIVIEPGGVIPTNWSASPLRFHITLDAAFGSRIAGYQAGLEGMRNAVFATSFYDGGYLNCSAFVDAYATWGGVIGYNFVTPFRFEDFKIEPLVQAVEEFKPDSILAQFSYDTGKLFLEEYGKSGLADRLKFYASPFLMEESFLETVPFTFAGMRGVVPWSRQLKNNTNAAFLAAMEEQGRQGNCFSALAWDVALFAIKATEAMAASKNNALKAADILKNIVLEGTRGILRHDIATNYFYGPMYHAEVVTDENGYCKLDLGSEVTYLEDQWKEHTAKPMTHTHSRWTNTYLCTT